MNLQDVFPKAKLSSSLERSRRVSNRRGSVPMRRHMTNQSMPEIIIGFHLLIELSFMKHLLGARHEVKAEDPETGKT